MKLFLTNKKRLHISCASYRPKLLKGVYTEDYIGEY